MSTIYFYKIVCKNPNIYLVYIGHTNNFNKRKIKHRSLCNNPNGKYYNYNIYKIMRDNGGFDNFEMLEIENRFCIDNLECRQIEQTHIINLNANMNTYNAFMTKEEKIQYYKEYRQNNAEKNKKYRLDNFDKIKENNKQYQLKNSEKIKEYQKQYQKDYYEKKKLLNTY